MRPFRVTDDALLVLDQTRLPEAEAWVELPDVDAAIGAIRTLAVRGAPLIGIVAAHALARAARTAGAGDLARQAARLRAARPTAVNLAWAVDAVLAAADAGGAAAALAEAERLTAEELAAQEAIATHGADALGDARRILTHCNAGALACGGVGTAVGAIAELHRRHGDEVTVLACETRPLLQGARLTAWELGQLGIAHAICVDGAAAGLIARGEIDAVITGADRVAANGDVANKVGTYAHALAAQAAGIPFVVAAPESTRDAGTPEGAAIVIEERDASEVLDLARAPEGTAVRNPAFDVTPAELVSALVTERGVITTVGGPAR